MKDMISLQKCMSIMIFMIWVWYHGDNFELEGKCIDLMKNAFMVWLCALNWFMHYLMILGQECEIKIRERSLGWKTQNLAKRRCSLRVNKPIKHKQGLGALMTLTIGVILEWWKSPLNWFGVSYIYKLWYFQFDIYIWWYMYIIYMYLHSTWNIMHDLKNVDVWVKMH